MKILFDFQTFTEQTFGGISRYISFLYKNINDSKVGVIFSNNEYLLEDKIGFPFFPNNWIPKKKKILYFINKLYSIYLIKCGKYDLLHATYYEGYYIKKYNIPVIVTVYDMIHEKLYNDYLELQDDDFIKKKKEALTNADFIIAISENTRKDVLELYPFINADKIRTVHLCLMIENELKFDNLQIGNEISIRPYFLFVGHRVMYKNFDLLINAFALLKEPQFDILIAGGGKLSESEFHKLKTLNIESRFIHIEIKNDIQLSQIYKNALAFISTSKYEGFGLPILEAFSNNCPVILADNPCYLEIAANGAEYFSKSNPSDLSQLLNKTYSDQNFRKDLALRGKERLKYFNKTRLIDETISCYQYILNKKV
jgi:glycosyltransferase involved in cell wall biosynthesis